MKNLNFSEEKKLKTYQKSSFRKMVKISKLKTLLRKKFKTYQSSSVEKCLNIPKLFVFKLIQNSKTFLYKRRETQINHVKYNDWNNI